MTTKRRRWHKVPGPLQDKVEDLAIDHPNWTPKQIYDQLETDLIETPEKFPDGIPEPRTVERIVKECRPPDPSGAWVPTDWPGEDVAPVLEALGNSQRMCVWEASWPTIREAERILWVRKTAPTLAAAGAHPMARRYLAYEAQHGRTEKLDWVLAYRVWEGAENRDAYDNAVNEGWIPGFDSEPGLFHWQKILYDREKQGDLDLPRGVDQSQFQLPDIEGEMEEDR